MKRQEVIDKWLERCDEYSRTIEHIHNLLESETDPKEIESLKHSLNSTVNRQAGHLEVLRDLGAFDK